MLILKAPPQEDEEEAPKDDGGGMFACCKKKPPKKGLEAGEDLDGDGQPDIMIEDEPDNILEALLNQNMDNHTLKYMGYYIQYLDHTLFLKGL